MAEVFHPEKEVRAILKVPTKERPKKLQRFREKLAEQKETLMDLQEELIDVIQKNPDIPLAELLSLLHKISDERGLTPQQKEVAEAALLKYEEKHRAVRAFRERYPDDSALYEALFRRKPSGRVEVVEGPMFLYFRCYAIDDYAWIRSGKYFLGGDLDFRDIDAARSSMGVRPAIVLGPGLSNVVIAENAVLAEQKSKKPDASAKDTLLHEEQHVFFGLFEEANLSLGWMHRIDKFGKKLASRLAWGEKFDLARELLRFLRTFRGEVENGLTKDEILAYIKDGTPTGTIYKYLTTPRALGGIYDYFENVIPHFSDVISYKIGNEHRDVAERIARGVLVNEYQNTIGKALEAVKMLQGYGYSTKRIVAFLQHEPLWKWKKAVERQLASGRFSPA